MASLTDILDKGEDAPHYIEELSTQAQHGDPKTQLLLGEYFLHQYEVSGAEEGTDYGTQAVGWLVKASRQGNVKATTLLQDCVQKEIGVTDKNKEDVLWCLQTSQLEKLARVSAQRMFRTLNPMQASEKMASLTKNMYQEGVELISANKKEKQMLQKAGKARGMEEVTEDAFVNNIIKKLYGSGKPQTMDGESKEEVDWETASWIQKLARHPTKTLLYVGNHTVDTAGSQGMVWLRSMIPSHQIYMLLVFFIYSLISFDVVLWVLPLVTFYIAFVALLVFTMQMFYSKKKLRDVKALAEMLTRFNDNFESDSALSNFSWNSLRPYLSFFVALLITVLSAAVADNNWIPCAEITIVCVILTFACFFALSDRYDYLAILSILLDNISTLPVFIEALPRIPVLYRSLEIIAGSAYALEVLPGMYLQLGLPSLAYMVVPLLFLRMALQNGWQGTYRVLIPHLVCFFWWRLAVLFFTYSTIVGLLRASVGWIMFTIFLPIIAVVFIFWLIFFIFSTFTVTNMLKVITTLALLTIPAGFAFWAKRGFKVKEFKTDKSKSLIIKVIMVILFATSVIPFAFVLAPPERNVQGHYLTWEKYRSLCSQPRWDETNIAESMVLCSQLSNTMVDWEGTVKKVVVKQIENQAEVFINMMPWTVANWLKCTYGDEYPVDCANITSPAERDVCEINMLQGRNCHLSRLNRYKFEMWVHMPIDEESVHDVRVEASHWFRESMMLIPSGATVNFRAALKSEVGNIWPVLKLYYIKCEDCAEPVEDEASRFYQQTGWNVFLSVRSSIHALWNFFMAPVIQFRDDLK